MSRWPNPLISGFNPDPSVVLVAGVYYLVTSTFEYLPGIPVYRSDDLVHWTQLGNVVTCAEQLSLDGVPTGGGIWAPTIRFHRGLFYVIVTVALSPRACVVFTATDPAGPWSEGTPIEGVVGIDPDLTWDATGTAFVTFSGLVTHGDRIGSHSGIQQVRVDLTTGKALELPRSMWSGTGLKAPEAPHLFRRGDFWYLLIAEGGTERGHSVSVARGESPEGPFVGHVANPVLSAKGTDLPIQNTGHADLVQTPDGDTAMVLLGMRPLGLTQAFSPLGRETFIAEVDWVDDWPVIQAVTLAPGDEAQNENFDFSDGAALLDPGWLAVRALPSAIGSLVRRPGWMSIEGDGTGLEGSMPRFVGRRQRHLNATVAATVDASGGAGGLALRYDEHHHVSLEARGVGEDTVVTGRACVRGLSQTWTIRLAARQVELGMEMQPQPPSFSAGGMGADRVRLFVRTDQEEHLLAELDGRYWCAETATSFTGRVIGLYARHGTVAFADYRYAGCDGPIEPVSASIFAS